MLKNILVGLDGLDDSHAAVELGLLVMGAHGQPVLRESFLGSTTHTVLEQCPVPVFCYH